MAALTLPKFDALREHIDGPLTARLSPLTYGHLSLPEVLTPVRTWIDKLEEWSKARLQDIEGAKADLEKARQERESFERMAMEAEDSTEAYNTLVETLHDYDRGIRDWREVQDLLPDPLGEHNNRR